MSETPINRILSRVGMRLDCQFTENFRREGFFNEKWQRTKRPSAHHTLLDTGALFNSLDYDVSGDEVTFFTHGVDYARLHNEGGVVVMTEAKRREFWAKCYDSRNTADKEYYRRLALIKIGTKMVIPKRQFVGDHPQVRKIVTETIEDELKKHFDGHIETIIE